MKCDICFQLQATDFDAIKELGIAEALSAKAVTQEHSLTIGRAQVAYAAIRFQCLFQGRAQIWQSHHERCSAIPLKIDTRMSRHDTLQRSDRITQSGLLSIHISRNNMRNC